MAQVAITWNAFKNNICQGLCSLQQNGEFVDMTLAADGHYVKVHQLIMSLVSPYIKDLIASATNCPHPVIFLNRVSYPTLVAILEYVYTGEVRVTREALPEVIDAAKELRIKGLEDMKFNNENPLSVETFESQSNSNCAVSANQPANVSSMIISNDTSRKPDEQKYDHVDYSHDDPFVDGMDTDMDVANDSATLSVKPIDSNPSIQYTVSNMGSLRMILNRFIYSLGYTSRKGPNGHRRWYCINDARKRTSPKCPAIVVTKGNAVIRRCAIHNHPFHDDKILKKVKENAIYTTVDDAQNFWKAKKNKIQ